MAQQTVNLASLELATHIILDPNRLDNGETATVRIQSAVPSLVGAGRRLCLMELDPEEGGPSREIARFEVDIVEKGDDHEFANVKRLDETEKGADGGGFVSTATVKELESRLTKGQKDIIAYQKAAAKKHAQALKKAGAMMNMSLEADTLPPPKERPRFKLKFDGFADTFEVFIYLAEEDLVFELGIDLYVDQECKFHSFDQFSLLDCSKDEDRGDLEEYSMYERVYGASAEKVALLNDPMVKAHQDAGVIAVTKYFPGIGAGRGDTHGAAVVIDKSLGELKNCELIPFQSAIDSGTGAIMISHVAYPQLTGGKIVPASMSREIITGLLRQKMGFEGLIITDQVTMEAVGTYMVDSYTGPSPADPTNEAEQQEYDKWHHDVVEDELFHRRAVAAIQAGCDMFELFLPSGSLKDERDKLEGILSALEQATTSGEIPAMQVEASVRRILEVKYAFYGQQLFANTPGVGTVDSLLKQMSLIEKLAQMFMLATYMRDKTNLGELGIGGYWVGCQAWDTKALQAGAKIPMMLSAEKMTDYIRQRRTVGIRFDEAI